MAITYVGSGAESHGRADVPAYLPAGTQAGDLLIVTVETANETVTAPTGYTEVASSPQGSGTPNTAEAVRLAVFWKIHSGSESDAIVPDSGADQVAFMTAYRGVDQTTPIEASAGSVQSTATASMVWPSVTTLSDDAMVVLACAQDYDQNSASTTGTLTNANLTSITKRVDRTWSTDFGGGIAIATGMKATAGATGTTTSTAPAAFTHAYVTMSLKPAAAPSPIEGTLAKTTDDATLAADGSEAGSIAGTLAKTTDDATLSAGGTDELSPISGTLAVTLDDAQSLPSVVANYARVVFTETHGAPVVNIGLIRFLDDVTPNTGTVIFSTEASSLYEAGNAFDADSATFWAPTLGDPWPYIGLQFASAVAISSVEITFKTQDSPNIEAAPKSFQIEVSSDGSYWATVLEVFYEDAWTDGETRSYAVSVDGGSGETGLAATLAVTTDDATLASGAVIEIGSDSTPSSQNATLAAAGALQLKADLSLTLDGVGLAANGSRDTASATLAVTLADAVVSGQSGLPRLDSTLAVTLDDAEISAAGALPVDAAAPGTTDNATLSSAGALDISVAFAITAADATLAASGARVPIEATLSSTLEDAVGASGANIISAGVVSITLDDATSASDSVLTTRATVAITLEAATSEATVEQPIVSSVSVTLARATLESIASLPDEHYLLCVVGFRVTAAGVAQTLWSNMEGNTGVKIEVTAANVISASGGNGTTIDTVTGDAVAVDTDYVATVEVRSRVMSVQLNDATPATVACELLDGSQDFTVGKDHGAASGYMAGRVYEIVGTKSRQEEATVDYIQRYVASRSAVAW